MAFPSTPLGVTVEMYLGAVLGWVDITADVRLGAAHSGGGIQISRGRANEGADTDPGRCSMTLNNRHGRYSPRNPASPYYGLIGRNTPIRVRVAEADPGRAVALPGRIAPGANGGLRVTTPHHASLAVTGDLDIRIWARSYSQWRDEGGVSLAGRYEINVNNRSWALHTDALGQMFLLWSPDGTLAARREARSVPLTPAADGTLAVRATLDVDNGAGGCTVTFYTASSLAGPWTQLGPAVTQAGTTAVFGGTAEIELGYERQLGVEPFAGELFGFELRSGIGGTLVASPNFTAMTVGATTLTDAQGRVWTLDSGASVIDRGLRFFGEVSSWPVRWEPSGRDRWVPIEAAGISRRLGQGASAVRSPLLRTLLAIDPAAYLPLEDGEKATRPSSSATGVLAGESRLVTFGSDTSLPGAASTATLNDANSVIITPVASRPTATTWSVMLLFKMTAIPSSTADKTYCRIHMLGGRVARWDLQASQTGYRWAGYDADGNEITNMATLHGTGAAPNGWVAMMLLLTKGSGTIDYRPVWHGVGSDVFYGPAPTTVTSQWGQPSRVEVTGADYMTGASVAHLVVDSEEIPLATDTFRRASIGYAGETTTARMTRLSAEVGVPVTFLGGGAYTETLGAQRIAPYLELMRDAAQADGGILGEPRWQSGLVYRPRVALYNQAALSIGYNAGHIAEPFEPVDDDDQVVNDVTVSRDGGGSARAVQTIGPLSVAAPPAGVGTYDTAVTVQIADDARLTDHAGWRLRLGTVDAARYPRVRANLAGTAYTANPTLRQQVALVDVGDVVELAGLPAWLPVGFARVMVQGYTETLDAYTWEITWNASPADPWDVATADGDARVAADGSTLAAGITSTATTLQVTSTADNGIWATDADSYPLDLAVGVERVRVDAVGQVVNADPWFASGMAAWTASNATVSPVAQIGRAGYAGVSVTAAGGTSGGVNATNRVTATAGATYIATVWVYSTVAVKVGPAVDWHTSGGAYLSTGFVGPPTVPAGIWTPVSGRLVAPATTGQAAMRARHDSTTTAGTVWLTTGATLVPASTVDTSPQTFTVAARSVNGIVSAWPSGTPVDVWLPAIAAL